MKVRIVQAGEEATLDVEDSRARDVFRRMEDVLKAEGALLVMRDEQGKITARSLSCIRGDMREVTQEEFQMALEEILEEYTGEMLLTRPGFYEWASEEFNNEALELAQAKIANAESDTPKWEKGKGLVDELVAIRDKKPTE